MAYNVIAKRWEHGWELHIDGIGVTQSRLLSGAPDANLLPSRPRPLCRIYAQATPGSGGRFPWHHHGPPAPADKSSDSGSLEASAPDVGQEKWCLGCRRCPGGSVS